MADNIPTSSYKTPQQLTVLQFDRFAEDQQKSMARLKAGSINMKAERDSQEALQKAENQWVINQYARVGELKEIGVDAFDKNKDDFFNGQIDKYIKIKNGIDNGTVAADVGGRALSAINDQVAAFAQAAPEVLAQAKIIQEGMKIPKGEPGAISAVNSTAQQKILLDLIEGGDVRIIDHNGELVLFQPSGKDARGNETEGGMINVNELINLEASGTEYIRTVPDLANPLKAAFTAIVGEKGKWNWSQDNNDFMTIETVKKDNREITTRTMTVEQRNNVLNAMATSKAIEPILKNQRYMESVWVDMMGEDDEWNAGDEDKVNKARKFLANKAIDDNALETGIKQILSYGGKGGGSDYKGDDPRVIQKAIGSDINNLLSAMMTGKEDTILGLLPTGVNQVQIDGGKIHLFKGKNAVSGLGVDMTKPGSVISTLKILYPNADDATIKKAYDEWSSKEFARRRLNYDPVEASGTPSTYNPGGMSLYPKKNS